MRKMLFLSVFSAFFLITGYSQVQQLGDPFFGENEYDYFGAGVAVSDDGNIVAFSSLGYDSFQENAGLVRVYSYNNGWVQLGSDINPGFGYNSFPGVSLEISGDGSVVIIEDTYNRWVAFKFNNNEWIQIGERYSPSPLESNSKGNLSANPPKLFETNCNFISQVA